MHFRTDVDIDEQAPALPRLTAYRRCKQMNPRWRDDLPASAVQRRGEFRPTERPFQQRAPVPAFH